MKKTATLYFPMIVGALLLSFFANAQTYSVTVNNGYGDGQYAAGDTVYIWAREMSNSEVFSGWSGTTVNDPEEWHTYFIMPAANITVSAGFSTLQAFTPGIELIMGRDTLKNVFYHFPANYKGVVYFFHGTNGSAGGWSVFNENLQMLREVVADTFAFIITDAEEVTYNQDFNNDGAQRWSSDTLDADYENIRIITDTMIARGYMTSSTKRIALGMSNGGTFSFSVADRLGFDVVVAYCAQGLSTVLSQLQIPSMWCMASQDGHPSVGPAANAAALASHQTLLSQGICSEYKLKPEEPLYPERFKRIAGIGGTLSQQLFSELQSNGWIGAGNFMVMAKDSIIADINQNPGNYPVYATLSSLQKTDFGNELDCSYADHQFFNSFAKKVLRFMNDPCSTTGVADIQPVKNLLTVFPVPADQQITVGGIEAGAMVRIFNSCGQEVLAVKAITEEIKLDVSSLSTGVYFLKTGESATKFIIQ